MTDVQVKRVLTPAEAKLLVGTKVTEPTLTALPSPSDDRDTVFITDVDTGAVVALITRLNRIDRADLRRAVQHIEMTAVARMSARFAGLARTFGWAPKRVMNGRESCRASSCAHDHPSEHQVLTKLGGDLADQFHRLMPEQYDTDRAVLDVKLRKDWLMEDRALWTSGVINHSATLPYHLDGANFHTWSAMPTLRFKMGGGQLHVPEYDMLFPCRDGEVTWFCGRDLVHGVTPMGMKTKDAYRFSIVYYATSSMQNCREHAEESVQTAARRTVRERAMAEKIRERMTTTPTDAP